MTFDELQSRSVLILIVKSEFVLLSTLVFRTNLHIWHLRPLHGWQPAGVIVGFLSVDLTKPSCKFGARLYVTRGGSGKTSFKWSDWARMP